MVVKDRDRSIAQTPKGENDESGLLKEFTPYLLLVLFVVLLCGFLFGYDQGVIAGAQEGVSTSFQLHALGISLVTSFVTLGAIIGALAAGEVTHRFGIKHTVTLASILFIAGALVQALAPNAGVLIAGRFIVGLGVGVGAVAAPIYAAELSPPKLRGLFISTYQFSITAGIFIAYLINAGLAHSGSWRWMLGFSAAPAVLLFIASLFAAESPRWLVLVHRLEEAATELRKVTTHPHIHQQLERIKNAMHKQKRSQGWSDLLNSQWRAPMLVGLTLAVIQQITGINAVIYYADVIFKAVGFTTQAERMMATLWAVGAVNMVATLIAVFTIDRVGRRFLMLVGLAGMAVGLIMVCFGLHLVANPLPSFTAHQAGVLALGGLICFIAFFAMSVGPVVWTIINEIFPAAVRMRAVALCTAVNWAAAFMVSQFFLLVVEAIGISLTFALFALISLVSWLWVFRSVPETKGHSLEEIQEMWQEKQKSEQAKAGKA